MRIYLSHPYGGKPDNLDAIDALLRHLAIDDPDNTYLSPVHCFGGLYNAVPYPRGLDMCLDLLSVCDRMVVYGDWRDSVGCRAEMAYCKKHGIPVEVRT